MAESNDFSQTQDATNDAIANFAHDEQSLKRKITNLFHTLIPHLRNNYVLCYRINAMQEINSGK